MADGIEEELPADAPDGERQQEGDARKAGKQNAPRRQQILLQHVKRGRDVGKARDEHQEASASEEADEQLCQRGPEKTLHTYRAPPIEAG